MSTIPTISKKYSICVICEGDEEFKYFEKLKSLNVWSEQYSFNLINAKSASNIFPRYQLIYNMDRYELILIFCDTDKAPHSEYKKIVEKINYFHDKKDIAERIIIYANPCTMQIVLSHFDDVELKTQAKKSNADIIKKLTGIENYDGHKGQIEEMCNKIFKRTYKDMKARVNRINRSYDIPTSTNFIIFLQNFENEDDSWIKEINELF